MEARVHLLLILKQELGKLLTVSKYLLRYRNLEHYVHTLLRGQYQLLTYPYVPIQN